MARSVSARKSMEQGSSVKRTGTTQGAGRRKKRLKYDIMEDDWGAEKQAKTTSEGAGEETEGVVGAGEQVRWGAPSKGAANVSTQKDGHQQLE